MTHAQRIQYMLKVLCKTFQDLFNPSFLQFSGQYLKYTALVREWHIFFSLPVKMLVIPKNPILVSSSLQIFLRCFLDLI